MSKQILFVCGNDETLLEGSYFQHTSGGDEAALAMVEAACRVIMDDGRADDVVDSSFSNWHGGQFDQFYNRAGNVAFSKDAPKWVEALARKADAAMDSARNEREKTAQAESREWFADCLRDGEEVNEWLIEEILFPAAKFAAHTRESIEAALRANDESLLVCRSEVESC